MRDKDRKEHGPFPELAVVLTPVAWIEGRAVDAETGETLGLSQDGTIEVPVERHDYRQIMLTLQIPPR